MEEQKLLKKKHKYLKEGNKTLLASVFNDLAELYLRESKYERSIESYSNAAKLYKENDDKKNYAKVNRMLGEVYMTIGQYDKAIKYEKKYLALARERNDKEEEQRALATIGRTHLTAAISNPDDIENESLNLALTAFLKSLMICESLKNISKHEQMDMRARLLLNIGLVHENQENYDSAIEYMMQCIKICKTYEIFDQLQHSYRSLGLLYSKKGDHSTAINYLNFSYEIASRLSDKIPAMATSLIAKSDVLLKLADFQSAKQVLLKAYKLNTPNEEEKEQIVHNLKVVAALSYTEESLLTIADSDYKLKKKLYEKMGDGACILKLYSKAIDYYKKMLDYAELNGDTGKDLIPVYVSLAQTYKDNKQYDLAIEYFNKEYEISRLNPKESFSTLISIAEVYEISKKDYTDIARIYEKARLVAHETGEKEKEGLVMSKFMKVMKKYGKITEANNIEKELLEMGYIESGSDTEEDESGTPNIGDDINISDISDESDNSENEENKTFTRTRKRGSKITIKKNLKGETALHTACIDGNAILVRRLLDQGHIVNVRDNAGWLPIHEACINGHKEIVEILVEKGANINDKGGIDCEGVTPLHDACCNGHLEIVEYLLENGANILLQNDNGETALDTLRQWRDLQHSLEPTQQIFYETIISHMATILEKAGRSTSPITKKRKLKAYTISQTKKTPKKTDFKRLSLENINKKSPHNFRSNSTEENFENFSKKIKKSPKLKKSLSSSLQSLDKYNIGDSTKKKNNSPRGKPIGTLRHMIDNGSSDEDTPSCSNTSRERLKQHSAQVTSSLDILENSYNDSDDNNSDLENSARNEYKRVMDNLRNRLQDNKPKQLNLNKSKKSAIIKANEDVNDDWLEDDVGINQPTKKRKFGNILKQNYLTTTTTRNSNSPVNLTERLNRTNSFTETKIANENDIHAISSDNEFIFDDEKSNDSYSSNNSIKRKKSQLSLLDSGFSRRCTSPERNINLSSNSFSKTYKRQSKISHFTVPSDVLEPDSTSTEDFMSETQISTLSTLNKMLYAISVRIENKLWRIPVPANDISDLTIGWLANEAAKRYYSKEGILPTLQLETRDGAILVNEDPLSIVFLSPKEPEEVHSTVLTWNLPPLPERYLEVCNNLKIDIDINLRGCLDETQGTLYLNLTKYHLNKQQIIPLFRALNRENNLQIINLSGCMILNEGVQQLCTSLPSLIQLRSLNLSMNNITSEGVRYISNSFSDQAKPILVNFYDLNLSYNLLDDDCLDYLSIITNNVKLRKLNLSACNLTNNIFDINPHIHLNLNNLETLDLSYNNLNKNSICKFISYLNFKFIVSLNFAHNMITETGITKEIALKLQNCTQKSIKSLNLARCKVNDAEIWDLLRFISTENHLELLNLSYNNDLTSVSLRRLIQCTLPPEHISLEGCDNIFQYLNESLNNTWTFDKFYPTSTLKSLKISLNYKEKPKETEFITSIWEQEWGCKAKICKFFNSIIHLLLRE